MERTICVAVIAALAGACVSPVAGSSSEGIATCGPDAGPVEEEDAGTAEADAELVARAEEAITADASIADAAADAPVADADAEDGGSCEAMLESGEEQPAAPAPVWRVLPERIGPVMGDCGVTEVEWRNGVCEIQVTLAPERDCPNSLRQCVRDHENVHVEQHKAFCNACAGYRTDALRQACQNCLSGSFKHANESEAYEVGCACERRNSPPGSGDRSDQCQNWASECATADATVFACRFPLCTTPQAILGSDRPRAPYCFCNSLPGLAAAAQGCGNFSCYTGATCERVLDGTRVYCECNGC